MKIKIPLSYFINLHKSEDVHSVAQPPQAHKSSHEDGGSDEINLAGLSGEPEALTTHKSATTGAHGAGDNYLAYAESENHIVLPFTAGWTSGKLLKGAGANTSPTEKTLMELQQEYSFVRAQAMQTQTIPHQTHTTVQLPNEIFDTLGEFNTSNYRFTAQSAGYYLAVGAIRYVGATIVANKAYYTQILRNGSPTDPVAVASGHAATTASLIIVAFTICYLAQNDYLVLDAYHGAGQDVDINTGDPYQTFLVVKRVA